jgi:hypothetical protein
MHENLSTEKDVTTLLKISPRKLRSLRLAKKIPFLRVDRFTRLYRLDEVVAALEIKASDQNGETK